MQHIAPGQPGAAQFSRRIVPSPSHAPPTRLFRATRTGEAASVAAAGEPQNLPVTPSAQSRGSGRISGMQPPAKRYQGQRAPRLQPLPAPEPQGLLLWDGVFIFPGPLRARSQLYRYPVRRRARCPRAAPDQAGPSADAAGAVPIGGAGQW